MGESQHVISGAVSRKTMSRRCDQLLTANIALKGDHNAYEEI
jgi:hypothetical protein